MTYSYRLFDSFDAVDLTAWERVRAVCSDMVDIDPRFINAVESSMRRDYRFWYLLVYDEGNRAVACAVLTGTTIDLADYVDPGIAKLIRLLPRSLLPLRRLRLLNCGLPVSSGRMALGLPARDTDALALAAIDVAMRELAAGKRMHAISYRDLRENDLERMGPLLDLGYQRIDALPAYSLTATFRDLEHYCAALKSHYRKQIKRSIRKLELAGVETRVLEQPDQILKVYTPEVHNLYHQMRDRAEVKLEEITIDYLRELTTRMRGSLHLILFYRESRIIAFGWCLYSTSTYYLLYAGLDYALNEELDLYFNLHYAALDCALRRTVATIDLGATADAFKARLGCRREASYVLAKGLTPLMSLVVRHGAALLAPAQPPVPAFDVFTNATKNSGARAS